MSFEPFELAMKLAFEAPMHPEQQFVPSFSFTEDLNFDFTKITKIDLLPNSQCFVLHNVLTELECKNLIDQGEAHGFLDLAQHVQVYRNNKRIINFNEKLKEILWKRISNYIEDEIEIKDGYPSTILTTYYTNGTWQKDHLYYNFRICKYNPTNFFKKHVDNGSHPDEKNHRSLKTCMVYLNSDFEGGETTFYFNGKHDEQNVYSLKAGMGSCLIFNQNILHEGMPVISGLKYFIRTDILYKKILTYNDGLTPRQNKAIELYLNAIELEKNGNENEANSLYKKARKTYDDVDNLYVELYG